MAHPLKNKKIAILIAHGFEQSEMTEPLKALEHAGATVEIISPEKDMVRAWKDGDWAEEYIVNVPLMNARADDYHGLVLPGGVMNPDKLRMDPIAVNFVKQIFTANKPIAAICHGPWTLINADAAKDHKLTSWPSLRVDLVNAGAEWVDEKVVTDKRLVTSRKPDDLPDFNDAMIKLFSEC